MYAIIYAVSGGASDGPEDDIFRVGVSIPTGRINFLGGIGQCNVAYMMRGA